MPEDEDEITIKPLDSGQKNSLEAGNDEDGCEHGAGVRLENIATQDEQPFACSESAAALPRWQQLGKAPASKGKFYVTTDLTLYALLA